MRPAQYTECSDCQAEIIPQRLWRTLNRDQRAGARAVGKRPPGGHGRCEACYRRWFREQSGGTVRPRNQQHFRQLDDATLARLRQIAGI